MDLSKDILSLFAELEKVAHSMGFQLGIESGVRTCADQKRVYKALGKPFRPCSYHLTGEAIDVKLIPLLDPSVNAPIDVIETIILNRQPGWRQALAAKLGARAEELGFRWGGRFADVDLWHFDNGRRRSVACCHGNTPVDSGRLPNSSRSEAARRGSNRETNCGPVRRLCDVEERIGRVERRVRKLPCPAGGNKLPAKKVGRKSGCRCR